MKPPPKRPAVASPQGATLTDRETRIRGVSSVVFAGSLSSGSLPAREQAGG